MHQCQQQVKIFKQHVAIEPTLLPLRGEHMIYSSANTEDGARLDVRARVFLGSCHEVAYLDVTVFNSFATSNRQKPLRWCIINMSKKKGEFQR